MDYTDPYNFVSFRLLVTVFKALVFKNSVRYCRFTYSKLTGHLQAVNLLLDLSAAKKLVVIQTKKIEARKNSTNLCASSTKSSLLCKTHIQVNVKI